jgi:Flp pilus assembly pilin Flp
MFRKFERATLVVRQLLSTRRDEAGATAVEYALMMAFIAAVMVTAVAMLGAQVLVMFNMGVALFP